MVHYVKYWLLNYEELEYTCFSSITLNASQGTRTCLSCIIY